MITLLEKTPVVFDKEYIGELAHFTKMQDSWLHIVELKTGDDNLIDVAILSQSKHPTIESIFDKVFSSSFGRPQWIKKALRGKIIKSVVVSSSVPVTSYKLLVERKEK